MTQMISKAEESLSFTRDYLSQQGIKCEPYKCHGIPFPNKTGLFLVWFWFFFWGVVWSGRAGMGGVGSICFLTFGPTQQITEIMYISVTD